MLEATSPLDEAAELRAVLERDEHAWRDFVKRFDSPLRQVVRHATEAIEPLSDAQVDDVLGDFWLRVVSDDVRLLRAFNPARGASLFSWLTFHVSHEALEYIRRIGKEPKMVPLEEAQHVPAPRTGRAPRLRNETSPATAFDPKLRAESRASTIDDAIRECVRSTVLTVVREELASANRKRDTAEADEPRPAAWWAKQLGCSAESLVKRAKRGSLECMRIGARYYFTRAQVEGSRRWQRGH